LTDAPQDVTQGHGTQRRNLLIYRASQRTPAFPAGITTCLEGLTEVHCTPDKLLTPRPGSGLLARGQPMEKGHDGGRRTAITDEGPAL